MTTRLPLEGLRVLDVSSFIAAPAAAVVLGDYGADVIKVEPPGEGDPHRGNINLTSFPKAEVNYPWHLDARNKRSIALDLKRPEARAALDRLIDKADILITNYPFPVRARLRLELRGSVRAQSTADLCVVLGLWRRRHRQGSAGLRQQRLLRPLRPPRCDPPRGTAAGLRAAGAGRPSIGDGAAVGDPARPHRSRRTGKGTWVASNLLANGLWSNGVYAQAALVGSYLPNRPPRERPRSALANIYLTSDDRWLQINVTNETRDWPAILEMIERPDLAADPRFAERKDRHANAPALREILDGIIRTRPFAHWNRFLKARAIPHSRINRLHDIPDDAQAVAARAVVETDIPEMPRTLAAPFQLGHVAPRRAGPRPDARATHRCDSARSGARRE